MHFVTESATLNLRERKMRRTAEQLTAVSRRLTAERGLAGFTIDELCEEVEVSRRTFFNYFASKEDAVIGANPDEESRRFEDEFLARRAGDWSTVLDDLVEMAIVHFDDAHIDSAEHGEFLQAIEREPRLLARFIGVTREREREAVAMVARRQGVDADDPRATATVTVLSALLRSTGDRLLDPTNVHDFSFLLTETLAAFRDVLAAPIPRKAAL
jgi:AcrR family transcriptional regulator